MNTLNKLFALTLLCLVAGLSAMDNKKRKTVPTKKQSRAKRVKVTLNEKELVDGICPNCDTEWLAQTDECPGCGCSTGLGDGYDVISGKYFVLKK